MNPKPNANRRIARAAGVVMFAIILGQIVNLAAKILTAHTFGTGMESEAFFAANRFAEILFNLVAGGALGSAFIPTFTTLLENDHRQKAWRLASAVANLVTLILIGLCVLSMIFAEQVVANILSPGFAADPAKLALTAQLLRIQLPSAIIFGLSGLVMGILNAHQRFIYAALAPSMYWLGWLVGVLLFAPVSGIYGLAAGVVLGSALHLGLQVPTLLSLPGRRYTLTLGLEIAEVGEVARLMAPRLLGVAVVQLNFLVNTNLASAPSMLEGSVTGISYAFSLMLMPLAAIAQSVAIAALPTFSAQVARGQLAEMRNSLAVSLRGVLLLAVPASVGLVILSSPLVAMLYQNREFTAISTALVAWPLQFYAAGLVGHSMVEIASRAFYALHDTKTPVLVGVATMSLNLVFSLLFSALFGRLGWAPHGGLALANTVATFLESAALLFLMRRRLGGLEGRKIAAAVLQASAAAAAMGLVLFGWLELAGQAARPAWQLALGGVILGGLVYGGVLWRLGASEVQQAVALIKSKVK
jgi:putative peptidoglycan lipid II flippase